MPTNKDNNILRVVLDSNVLLSALIFGGKPREVIEWLIKNATVVYSAEIITEIRRVVTAKFPSFSTELSLVEKLLERDAIKVKIGSLNITASRDPGDNAIIETAMIGACQYIVSGDNDLLVLKAYEGITLLRPADFLNSVVLS